jgi:thioredoxin 1
MGVSTAFASVEPTRAEIDAQPGALVLEFGAPWCGHCLAAQPYIAQAFADQPGIAHIKVEDGRGQPLGRSFRVQLWPTLVFLRDGQEIARLVRPRSSEPIAEAMRQITAV